VRILEAEQGTVAAEAARAALETELARAEQVARERDAALGQARADFTAELEKLRQSAELAETRLQAAEKRALLEFDRERAASAHLQRDAETAAQRAARNEESARAEIQGLQTQLGDLRHHAGMLEGRLEALRASHASQRLELEATRARTPKWTERGRGAPARRPSRPVATKVRPPCKPASKS
jgi:hypothetical protein